jgi:hypothetical protein
MDDLRPEPSAAELYEEIDRLRAKVLRHGNVLGAAAALLNAIHRAGGYHIADPKHQDRIQASMAALEAAVVEALA